jgi:hypothetical protein
LTGFAWPVLVRIVEKLLMMIKPRS